jgi:hypothetical protein
MEMNENNNMQQKLIEEANVKNEEVVKKEAGEIRELIAENEAKLLRVIRELEERNAEVNKIIEGLQRKLQLNIMGEKLRESAMLGRLDSYKDELYEMRKIIGTQLNYFPKLEGKFKETNNQTSNVIGICDSHVMQLNSTIMGIFGIIEELKRNAVEIRNSLVELDKKVSTPVAKIEPVKVKEESAEKKDKSNKGKGKGRKKKDSSDDEDGRDNYPDNENNEEREEEEELIDILRNQKGVTFDKEGKITKTFDWIGEIENIWKLIRNSNIGMAACKEEARKYVCKLRDNYSFNCPSRTKDLKNPKVIVKKSREPLIERLCKNGNVPHPFIVQCIKQSENS